MNGTGRLFLFHLLLLFQIKSACSLCNIPPAWLGSWYQRGMSSLLEITVDHVQTKGHCLGVIPKPQYYLFTDQLTRCSRCLLFIERHPNLLQYRESECNDPDDLSSVTACPNMIAPDAALYTLHRNNSLPQLCPIQPPYLLTKLKRDGSVCRQSLSSSHIGECATDNQFRLRLPSCSSYQQTLDLQLSCVGTWIEGFHTYFVTRILSTDPRSSNNNQYACFYFLTKPKEISSSFSLSMATDDSCRDLNSKYMATVMTLSTSNRHADSEWNTACQFPEDVEQHQWYSLNRTIQMIIKSTNIELIYPQQKGTYQRYHCLQTINPLNYRIRSFKNCDAHEQCLQIHRPANNVLELILHNCVSQEQNRTLTFLSKSHGRTSCPTSIGRLLLESNPNNHHHRSLIFRKQIFQMSVGCDQKEKLMIYQTEKDPQYNSITQTDTCLASWSSDDSSTVYVIAQSVHSNSSYCLSFQMKSSILIRNNSHECSFNTSEDQRSIFVYSAKLLTPCSQSPPFSFRYTLLIISILISFSRRLSFVHSIIHSKQ